MTSASDLARLRAARLQARRCCDFHEENIEKLTRDLKDEQRGLASAREALEECENQIKQATRPETPDFGQREGR
jgi:hypothetical protein